MNRAARSATSYNHFSTGRAIEEALGLAPPTPNDRYAEPINDAFVALAPPPAPTLSTATPSVRSGASIAFDYGTPSTQSSTSNWVGIYASGVAAGTQNAILWRYAPNRDGSLSFSTGGLAAGNYAGWYCYADGYSVLAGPVAFTLTN